MLIQILALSLSAAAVPSSPALEARAAEVSVPGEQAICPVTGKALAPGKGVKVNVRGREYTVADEAAAEELKANPDKYLESDGTPKNQKK